MTSGYAVTKVLTAVSFAALAVLLVFLTYPVKDAPVEQLADAVRRVHSGLRVVDPAPAEASLFERRQSAQHRVGARADRRGQGDLVDIPRARTGGRLIAHDQHKRHTRLHGFRQRGEGIGETSAVGGGSRCDSPAGPVVRVGGNHGALLMAHGSEPRRSGAFQSIEEVGVAVAHHAEDGIDVLGEGTGDVGGHRVHGRAFRDGTVRESVCVSRSATLRGASRPFFEHRSGRTCQF